MSQLLNTMTGHVSEVVSYGIFQRITLGEDVNILLPIINESDVTITVDDIGRDIEITYWNSEVCEWEIGGEKCNYLKIFPTKIKKVFHASYEPIVQITGAITSVVDLDGPGVEVVVGGVRVSTLPVKRMGIVLTEADLFITHLEADRARDLYVIRPAEGTILQRVWRKLTDWLK